jgi:hypothetical protein
VGWDIVIDEKGKQLYEQFEKKLSNYQVVSKYVDKIIMVMI